MDRQLSGCCCRALAGGGRQIDTLTVAILAIAALWIVVLVQGAVLIELLRQLGVVRASLHRQGAAIMPDEGLATGTSIEWPQTLRSVAGQSILVDGDGRDTLMLFLSVDCGTCLDIGREVADFGVVPRSNARLLVVLHGAKSEAEQFVRDLRLPPSRTIHDESEALTTTFNVLRYPSAAVVARDRTLLAYGLVNTIDQAAALYDLTVIERETANGPKGGFRD